MNYKQLLWSGLFAAQALACSAQNDRTSISNHNGETEIRIQNSKEDLELTYKGELQFNDAETGIKSLTPNTSLRFSNGGNKLEVIADGAGRLQYRCNGGTATAEVSAACAPLLRQAIEVAIRSGVGAKERAARLYARGGFPAVMSAIDRLPTDYVRSIYFKILMDQSALTAANWTTMAQRIRSNVSSDYEKAGLLRKLIAKTAQQPGALPAFFDAAATVGSDYERAGVLNAAFEQKFDAAYYPRALEVAASMKSDYEKGRVLKTAAAAPGVPVGPLLSAAATMGSDYEKANVLKQLVSIAGNNEDTWVNLLSTTRGIKSDYEKTNVLINAAQRMPRSQKVIAEYRKTAATIGSEYELGRATKALGTQA
jgi:hypothetical protein